MSEAQVKTHVTPHQMRYAFSDLLRHKTVRLDEKRDAMQAVAEKLKEVRLTVLQGGKGYESG